MGRVCEQRAINDVPKLSGENFRIDTEHLSQVDLKIIRGSATTNRKLQGVFKV
jgi:hypothetical protein